MRILILAILLCLPALSQAAGANSTPMTTAEQIQTATREFLQAFAAEQANNGYRVTYETASVDSRLTLAPCSDALGVRFSGDPLQSRRPSLEIRCDGQRPWRMYTTPEVVIEGQALVAARAIARGEQLSADLVKTETVTVNDSHRGYVSSLDAVDGMTARRPINSGVAITPDLLDAPNAVSRGDHVMIIATNGVFSVTSRGKALADASVGEQVMVENLKSSRTIRANVIAPGKVQVTM
ncbi:flagellar basal body P-ring formation chaperone FlgA [Marinobacter sp. C2H3]|uniref:flagellar basal body P-ring formation chaperone FlgA n=1 Tax=Marinobacter sp. C2H3 TaxID=3119003 RepID=UPI00300E79B2